jgi:hypothetical protein
MTTTPKNNFKQYDQESLKQMQTSDSRQNINYNHNNDDEKNQKNDGSREAEKIQELSQEPKESVQMNQDFTRKFPSYLVVPSARNKERKPASDLNMVDVNESDL